MAEAKVHDDRTSGTGPIILDGRRLAHARAPELAARAAAVAERIGRRPRLGLLAFPDADGTPPWADRKVRAGAAAGVEVVPLILPAEMHTEAAKHALAFLLADGPHDAIFLEFPFPPTIDGDALVAMVPEVLDVDVMTIGRIAEFYANPHALPPLTVTAALELLDAFGVDVAGRSGIVVGDASPFTEMFAEALARRGATMAAVLSPGAPDLAEQLTSAQLVVAAAARPGIVASASLPAGSVVIDVGYFNPDGRGDVDLRGGIKHLGALAPVPGAIGPMTVSMLIERTIAFAERGTA